MLFNLQTELYPSITCFLTHEEVAKLPDTLLKYMLISRNKTFRYSYYDAYTIYRPFGSTPHLRKIIYKLFIELCYKILTNRINCSKNINTDILHIIHHHDNVKVGILKLYNDNDFLPEILLKELSKYEIFVNILGKFNDPIRTHNDEILCRYLKWTEVIPRPAITIGDIKNARNLYHAFKEFTPNVYFGMTDVLAECYTSTTREFSQDTEERIDTTYKHILPLISLKRYSIPGTVHVRRNEPVILVPIKMVKTPYKKFIKILLKINPTLWSTNDLLIKTSIKIEKYI